MSYQVIARKYRPQTFSDLTGQEHITRTLGNALNRGRLHHAYLFSGVRGTGKTTTARILAKGLNCHKGVTSEPCLSCPSCLEIAAGASLDVLEIDAASNTGVDNVRDVIINNIGMMPARDRYKVFVIDEVHMLSTSAFNALLKTLEEPPLHVVFIMATTELHKVPDTILSRCQQFEFRQIATEKIFRRLREIAEQEKVVIDDAALREVARAGAGSLRDAQSALDQVIAFSGEKITEQDVTSSLGLVSAGTLGNIVEAIGARDSLRILTQIDEINARGYDLRNFTRELMAYVRHLLLVRSGIASSETLGVADVEIERLKQLAGMFSEEDLTRCFHLLAETEKAIKDSPHPRFQLEIGLLKLSQATRLRSLEELIARLEGIEAGSGPGSGAISAASAPVQRPGPAPEPKSSQPRVAQTAPAPAPIPRPQTPPRVEEPPDSPDSMDWSEPVDPFEELAPAPPARSAEAAPSIRAGGEIDAILNELHRSKKAIIATAIEDARTKVFQDDLLTLGFDAETVFSKKIRESAIVFRDMGTRLFGRPLRVEIKISGQGEEPVDPAEVKKRELRERVLKNPAIALILEKTRGELLTIKESAPPPASE